MGMAQAHAAFRNACSLASASEGNDKVAKQKSGEAEIEIAPGADAISEALERDGKIYRKEAEVEAVCASTRTPVETVLADRTRETDNVAEPGDYIVTGGDGERWVVKPETFQARYVLKRGRKHVYIGRGQVMAVENPYRRPISIMAPWGERQHGAADCMIADIFDPAKRKRAGEPYLIARAEFGRTYKMLRPGTKK